MPGDISFEQWWFITYHEVTTSRAGFFDCIVNVHPVQWLIDHRQQQDPQTRTAITMVMPLTSEEAARWRGQVS